MLIIGRNFFDEIKQAWGLPDDAVSVTITLRPDDVVRVKVESINKIVTEQDVRKLTEFGLAQLRPRSED